MNKQFDKTTVGLNRFTVRKPGASLPLYVILLLNTCVIFALFIFSFPIWGNPTASWEISATVLFFALLSSFMLAHLYLWKVKIINQEIHYRFFMGRKTFQFASITRAEIDLQINKLALYSNGELLLLIKLKCVGYHNFVARLKQEGIEIVMFDSALTDPSKFAKMQAKEKRMRALLIGVGIAVIIILLIITEVLL